MKGAKGTHQKKQSHIFNFSPYNKKQIAIHYAYQL